MLHTTEIYINLHGGLLVGVRTVMVEVWTHVIKYGNICDLWGHHIVVSPSFPPFIVLHAPFIFLSHVSECMIVVLLTGCYAS